MTGWLWSFLYAVLVAFAVVVVFVLIIAVIAWCGGGGRKRGGCRAPSCPPLCPVYLRNPEPDDRTFLLARRDGSASGSDNGCATGSFTVQRTGPSELQYTITTPDGTLITDVYTLEVAAPNDFPLTSDGCAVDLTLYRHATFPCDDTSNVQTVVAPLNEGLASCREHIYISILVVMSDVPDTCTPLQMMTLRTGHPVRLTGNCVTPPCAADTCCDPVVPHYARVCLPRCRATAPVIL
jgi:hypothetical protein